MKARLYFDDNTSTLHNVDSLTREEVEKCKGQTFADTDVIFDPETGYLTEYTVEHTCIEVEFLN